MLSFLLGRRSLLVCLTPCELPIRTKDYYESVGYGTGMLLPYYIFIRYGVVSNTTAILRGVQRTDTGVATLANCMIVALNHQGLQISQHALQLRRFCS